MIQQPPKTTRVTFDVSVDDDLTEAFDMGEHMGGFVVVPTAWDDANIGFKICPTYDGTYVIAKDDTGVPIQISGIVVDASYYYQIPTDLFGATWCKLWSKHKTAATVSNVAQTADRAMIVVLK